MGFDFKLTKDADYAMCLIYKAYLDRKSSGMPRNQAKDFSTVQSRESFYSSVAKADFNDCLRELRDAELIRLYRDSGFLLDNKALLYMENRFPRGIEQLISVLSEFKGAIPGI